LDLKKYEYYRTELGVLYHADCLSIMPMLEPVDLVLTDPPYGIGKAEWDYVDFKKLIRILVEKFKHILKENNAAFIWIPKKAIYYLNTLSFKFDVFMFVKNFAPKKAYDCFIDAWVPMLVVKNGNPQFKGKNWLMLNTANTSKTATTAKNIGHPTPKDFLSTNHILTATTTHGDLVFDPFLGSGTTAIACERLNRRWIGIEISEKYCEIAAKRIEAERSQLKLF